MRIIVRTGLMKTGHGGTRGAIAAGALALAERRSVWVASAGLTVNTSDRSVAEIAEEVRHNVLGVGHGGRWKSST